MINRKFGDKKYKICFNTINVFPVTFKKCNLSLLNKRSNFLKKSYPKHLNSSVYMRNSVLIT